jgi:hypothetical protein
MASFCWIATVETSNSPIIGVYTTKELAKQAVLDAMGPNKRLKRATETQTSVHWKTSKASYSVIKHEVVG